MRTYLNVYDQARTDGYDWSTLQCSVNTQPPCHVATNNSLSLPMDVLFTEVDLPQLAALVQLALDMIQERRSEARC
jgi:hypothetical protein